MGGGQQPTRASRREDRAQVTERLRQVKATTRLRPTDRKPNEPGLNPTARRWLGNGVDQSPSAHLAGRLQPAPSLSSPPFCGVRTRSANQRPVARSPQERSDDWRGMGAGSSLTRRAWPGKGGTGTLRAIERVRRSLEGSRSAEPFGLRTCGRGTVSRGLARPESGRVLPVELLSVCRRTVRRRCCVSEVRGRWGRPAALDWGKSWPGKSYPGRAQPFCEIVIRKAKVVPGLEEDVRIPHRGKAAWSIPEPRHRVLRGWWCYQRPLLGEYCLPTPFSHSDNSVDRRVCVRMGK